MVKKRITVTIDAEIDKKIRQFQAALIRQSNRSWSYSSVLEFLADEGIKKLNIPETIM